jgi:hypothetical protein
LYWNCPRRRHETMTRKRSSFYRRSSFCNIWQTVLTQQLTLYLIH